MESDQLKWPSAFSLKEEQVLREMLAKRKTTQVVRTDEVHVTSGAVESVGRREVRKPVTPNETSQKNAIYCAESSFPMHLERKIYVMVPTKRH